MIGTPDDLLLACKIAAGKGHKRVIATKDLVTYMLNNEPGYSVMVSGVEVVAEGFEEQADRDKAKTMEQVNFGKV